MLLEKRLEKLEMSERIKTTQITAVLNQLEYLKELRRFAVGQASVKTGVKNLQRVVAVVKSKTLVKGDPKAQ